MRAARKTVGSRVPASTSRAQTPAAPAQPQPERQTVLVTQTINTIYYRTVNPDGLLELKQLAPSTTTMTIAPMGVTQAASTPTAMATAQPNSTVEAAANGDETILRVARTQTTGATTARRNAVKETKARIATKETRGGVSKPKATPTQLTTKPAGRRAGTPAPNAKPRQETPAAIKTEGDTGPSTSSPAGPQANDHLLPSELLSEMMPKAHHYDTRSKSRSVSNTSKVSGGSQGSSVSNASRKAAGRKAKGKK